MALNPAIKQGSLNSPTERANDLNDPQFSNDQGYFPYDLTHQSFITPNFGNITPTLILDTVPGDRTVVRDNTKLILNRIDGNFLSTMNQYVDSFYVPMRSCFPVNYEKLMVNPVKGDDLPNSALPQFPLGAFIHNYLTSTTNVDFYDIDGLETSYSLSTLIDALMNGDLSTYENEVSGYLYSRLTLLFTVLSRGQLLDYLNFGLDIVSDDTEYISKFQSLIDDYFQELYNCLDGYGISDSYGIAMHGIHIEPSEDRVVFDASIRVKATTKPEWRQGISDILERGEMVDFTNITDSEYYSGLETTTKELVGHILEMFDGPSYEEDNEFIDYINEAASPFANGHFINIGRVLAYQQVVAQYFTNDSIDNIFSSDLYMQLLRSVMYPSIDGITNEPTFDFNGVPTEYDYISVGGSFYSLISDRFDGHTNRQYIWMTLMFLLRRSLAFGNYFNTSRPNMLSVGQLGVNVEDGAVSPVDITKNLLMQRYLNASNRVGNKFLQYYASMHGVTPSDTGTFPRFISHRKIEIQNQVTNNTAESQGHQTTNLVGYSDNSAFDVFIDDYGYLISLTSFDILPVYTSGIEANWHLSDRFDYFNPMLQGIGDQAIRSSELLGNPNLYNDTFGYVVRDGNYKFATSKAHGAFVNNELAGYMMKYPINILRGDFEGDIYDLKINPDFIRDKSIYLDAVIPEITGCSPATYFQFVCSCTNEVHSARKMQATPPILF